jgi:hypothetical protein
MNSPYGNRILDYLSAFFECFSDALRKALQRFLRLLDSVDRQSFLETGSPPCRVMPVIKGSSGCKIWASRLEYATRPRGLRRRAASDETRSANA